MLDSGMINKMQKARAYADQPERIHFKDLTVEFDGKAVPVFGTVKEAMETTSADVSVVFVPPKFAKDARTSPTWAARSPPRKP